METLYLPGGPAPISVRVNGARIRRPGGKNQQAGSSTSAADDILLPGTDVQAGRIYPHAALFIGTDSGLGWVFFRCSREAKPNSSASQ